MRMTFGCIAALVTSCTMLPAHAYETPITMKQCVALSSEMNKTVPLVVDELTTLDSTFCTPGKRKPVLNYRASMAARKVKLVDFDAASHEMKRLQTNSWCTDPAQLALLRKVDVLNRYYDHDRIFIGTISLTLADCANVR